MNDLCSAVGQCLKLRRLTLSLAESCTGGLLGHWVTEVPGSSDYFRGGVVAYHDDVKERLLGVGHSTLQDHGAVSSQTAEEMAQGARRVLGADLGLSTTGIAGPGGGSPKKPVGLVYIALATPTGTWCERHLWDAKRSENKIRSASAALDLLLRYLNGQTLQPASADYGPA